MTVGLWSSGIFLPRSAITVRVIMLFGPAFQFALLIFCFYSEQRLADPVSVTAPPSTRLRILLAAVCLLFLF